jgi:hypothetical protein
LVEGLVEIFSVISVCCCKNSLIWIFEQEATKETEEEALVEGLM